MRRRTAGLLASSRRRAVAPAAAYLRGVNDAGGEFAESTGVGVYGTDWQYDSQGTFDFLAARGHKVVRLPFRWERVQPTRGAALDATLMTRLTDAVARAKASGLTVILDMHNYCRRFEGSVEVTMGADFSDADLVDVWTRLSTTFKGETAIEGYGLMNEPHDLIGLSTTTGPELVGNPGFETDLTGWTASDSTLARDTTIAHSGTASMSITSTSATADARAFTSMAVASSTNYAVGYSARGTASSVGRNTFVGIDWFDSTGTYLASTFVDYFALTDGTWKNHLVQVTSPAGAARCNYIVGFQTSAIGQVMYADDVTFKAGTVTAPERYWESVSQKLVDAIRGNADTKRVYVGGYAFSSAKNWATIHPDPWITDASNATTYEAHFYFDRDNSGKYVFTYADEEADAVARGYVNLAARATDEIDNFTAWCSAKGVKGFIGEVGWPNTGDTVGWNSVGEAVYDVLDAAGMGATFWAAGEFWGATYLLSIYTGSPHATATSIAPTIEAHPTR